MPNLLPIAVGQERVRGSVIFIHGLGGDPWTTWGGVNRDDPSFWPRWLADEKDLAKLSFYTLQYQADRSELYGNSMSITDHGESALAELTCNEALSIAPIAFVCYSLGGLVLKQLMRAAADESNPESEARKKLLDQIAQIVFIATPHRGAKLPAIVDRIAPFFPSVVLRNLKEDDEHLLKLTGWYTNFCGSDNRTIAHVVFRETKKTYVAMKMCRVMVVDESSSNPSVPSETYPIEANHIDICKPPDRNSTVYKKTLNLLKKLAFTCPWPVSDSVSKGYCADAIPLASKRETVLQIKRSLQDGWRLDEMGTGTGCTNPDFNLQLVAAPPTIPLHTLKKKWIASDFYHDDLRKFVLAEKKQKPGDFFNGDKIRIATDFIGPGANGVAIQETDYLSSLMTDQHAWVTVRSKSLPADRIRHKQILWDGKTPFIEEDAAGRTACLKGFEEAVISNQLGASTLAFSSDGHLMIVYNSDTNLWYPNMLAPSGSGSLDWSDVAASNADDLVSLVRFGAERELREECGLNDDGSGRRRISSKVMVTSFVRVLDRAGKPEFFCLGRIDARSGELCDRKHERYVERLFPEHLSCADWSIGQPVDSIRQICMDYLDRRSCERGARIPLSYPLEHALRLLVEVCQYEATSAVVNRFMSETLAEH